MNSLFTVNQFAKKHKKRKVNKAWNSYIEPRRSEIESYQDQRRYEIGQHLMKKGFK